LKTGPPERLRLFIALQIPEDIKDELENAQSQLRRAVPSEQVRWAKREQFHLTLKFLGSVEHQRVPALTDAVSAACQKFGALSLRAQGIGCFPDYRFPRVIWAGVADLQQQLPLMQSAVQLASQEFTNEEPEERFTGHVTLGRIKHITRPAAEALAKSAAKLVGRNFGEWIAHELHIMRSELSPKGARYSALASIPFR